MLSVCIPVYNFDVRPLVESLSRQISTGQLACDIVLIDDASDTDYQKINRLCTDYPAVTYVVLEENIGRARIRNLFLKHTQQPYLLFLDCDSQVIKPDFLKQYLCIISQTKPQVLCGGRIYPDKSPGRHKHLRWKYGVYKESRSLENRLEAPNRSFMTNNFLINRELFNVIQFEERLVNYGHEDTLFGFELKQKHIEVRHIDNPVLNGNLEDNALYLRKTEAGINNLILIIKYLSYDEEFIREVTLLGWQQKISRKKLTGCIRCVFLLFRKPIRFLLYRGVASLLLFNFYKLAYLIYAFDRCKHRKDD